MKKLFLYLTVIFTSITTKADPIFIKNTYWQAAVDSKYTIRLISTNTSIMNDLTNECTNFSNSIFKSEIHPSELEIFDTLPLDHDNSNLNFSLVLKIDISSNRLLDVSKTKSLNYVTENSRNDLLPSYTQQGQVIKLDFEQSQLGLNILKKENSLYNLFLINKMYSERKLSVISQIDGYYIQINNKSIACDLLFKKIEIINLKPVSVIIDYNQAEYLKSFYKNIQDQIISIINLKNTNNSVKAMLIGFKLKDFFKDESNLNTSKEERFLSLIQFLINPENLTYTSLWDFNSFGYYLNVNNYVYTDKIKIDFQF